MDAGALNAKQHNSVNAPWRSALLSCDAYQSTQCKAA